MSSENRVHVVDYGPGRNLAMRYSDPMTGKQHAKTTGTKKRKEAEKVAAVWESQLRAGQYKPDGRMPWDVFLDRYNKEHLARLRDGSEARATGVLSMFKRICHPANLQAITATMLSTYQTELRARGRSESTITTHMATLRAALQWAVDLGYLNKLPSFRQAARTRRGKGKVSPMKGRPLTNSEFALLLLDTVPRVVTVSCAEGSCRFLCGLWTSGLRLEESLVLSWDDPARLMVDTSGRRAVMRIDGDSEKGGQTRVLPIAPEFSRFLDETPSKQRTGRVFKLPKRRRANAPYTLKAVSRIVSRIERPLEFVSTPRAGDSHPPTISVARSARGGQSGSCHRFSWNLCATRTFQRRCVIMSGSTRSEPPMYFGVSAE